MNSTTKSVRRPTIALALPRSAPALISYAQGIVMRMTGNASFPAPVPTLAAVTAALADLQTAETAALARTKGAVTARNEKRGVLVAALQQLRAYVQSIADADPTQAPSIIESAGVAVRKTPTRTARAFAAKPGPVAGVAKVTAVAASRRASYEWQYSADGGKTWISARSTLQARTTIAGLASASTVQFRYRAVTKTGEGDWSQPTSLMVP